MVWTTADPNTEISEGDKIRLTICSESEETPTTSDMQGLLDLYSTLTPEDDGYTVKSVSQTTHSDCSAYAYHVVVSVDRLGEPLSAADLYGDNIVKVEKNSSLVGIGIVGAIGWYLYTRG